MSVYFQAGARCVRGVERDVTELEHRAHLQLVGQQQAVELQRAQRVPLEAVLELAHDA